MQEAQDNKRTMAKGIRYPMFDLEDAYKIALDVSRLGRGKIDIVVLAESMNFSPSYFRHHVNSAKYFNLVELKDNLVINTNLANKLCTPLSDNEKIQNLQKAFFSSEIYNKLYERLKDGIVPEESTLSNLLHREFEVSITGKDILARNFISSLKFSRLVDTTPDGKLVIPSAAKQELAPKDEKPTEIISTVDQYAPKAQDITKGDTDASIGIEVETYRSKGLFLQVDPTNVHAINKGIKFLTMLLPDKEN